MFDWRLGPRSLGLMVSTALGRCVLCLDPQVLHVSDFVRSARSWPAPPYRRGRGVEIPGVTILLEVRECQLAARPPNLWIGEISVLVVWDEPMERCGRSWFECPLWQAAGAAS